jgi:cyanate lyase
MNKAQKERTMMSKSEMTKAILQVKAAKGLTWEGIADKIGMSPVWTTSLCLGMNSAPAAKADALCDVLGLGPDINTALQAFPHKSWDKAIPTDPVLYRFYEMFGVYGDTVKELIHEKFGDGIMSAIDFSMHIEKEPDPKGDRVKITLNGKFLPYKSW